MEKKCTLRKGLVNPLTLVCLTSELKFFCSPEKVPDIKKCTHILEGFKIDIPKRTKNNDHG